MGNRSFSPRGLWARAWSTVQSYLAASRKEQKCLFASHEHNPEGSDALREMLREALRRLELSHAMITVRQGQRLRVLHLVSRGYGYAPGLKVGMALPSSVLFCGALSESRRFLAVDLAGLTNWRHHPACETFGWETYIGAGAEMGEYGFVSVSCFDFRPREHLFSTADREYLLQLSERVGQALHPFSESGAAGGLAASGSSREAASAAAAQAAQA